MTSDWRLVDNVTEIRKVCRGARGNVYLMFCTPQNGLLAEIRVSRAAVIEAYETKEAGDLYYRFDGHGPVFYFEAVAFDD